MKPQLVILMILMLLSGCGNAQNKKMSNGEEPLPNDFYTKASKTLMDALVDDRFEDFENMLDEDAETILYDDKTVHGKADVLAYWLDWRKKHVETKETTRFEVVLSRYDSHACLKVERNQLVMFQIKDEKISKIVSLPLHLTSIYSDDNMLNYPLDYERVKPCLTPMEETVDEDGKPIKLTDRIPCLHCGLDSKDLTWYRVRIPNGSNRNWRQGVVSVCPQCGRVVEYKDMKTMESDDEKEMPIEDSMYSDKGNAFSDCADKIIPEDMDDGVNADNVEAYVIRLLKALTDVSMEQGYRLEMKLPVEKGRGDRTHILAVDEKGNETEEMVGHLKVRPTEMGAWQLYLLERLPTVLPLWWHGLYLRRHFILRESDIEAIIPLKYHDLSELKVQDKLMPCVQVSSDEAEGYSAVVHCCYWNDWEGLVRERVAYKFENSRVVSKDSSKDILFHFHCGIYY